MRDIYTNEVFFVHYSQIRPKLWPLLGESWYKPVLYTNEYVEFGVAPEPDSLSHAPGSARRACATNITGINNGTLMMDMSVLKVTQYRKTRPQHLVQQDNQNTQNNDNNHYILNNQNNQNNQNTQDVQSNASQAASCGTETDLGEDDQGTFQQVNRSGRVEKKSTSSWNSGRGVRGGRDGRDGRAGRDGRDGRAGRPQNTSSTASNNSNNSNNRNNRSNSSNRNYTTDRTSASSSTVTGIQTRKNKPFVRRQ